MAQFAQSGKAKLSTVDYLEADRLEFHYRIAVQDSYRSYFACVQYVCAILNIADTPS